MTALWIALALLAVLGAAALTAWLLVRARRAPAGTPALPARRAAAPEPATAVVLVHGLLGFDRIQVLGVQWSYFRGIAPRLQARGVRVHVVRVPPLASVPERAARLAEQVAALPDRRVVLLAHSMGGLDARWAIARLGLADRVAALISIGTPHRGAPLAELGGRTALVRLLGGDRTSRALEWLTPARLRRFNVEVPDHPDVFYGSVVGALRVGGLSAGTSDGLVPVASQRWGEVMAELDADHWAQIGWSRSFDAAGAYLRILDRLGERGLFRASQSAASSSRAATG
ncbi:MAG TPA: hypothetical protein VL172_10025 [Kofleriaceae bacterium]|nr:hypothetical protein [Kofleriaceae bacterium]